MSGLMIESEHHIPIARADTHPPPSSQVHTNTVLECRGGTKRRNGDGNKDGNGDGNGDGKGDGKADGNGDGNEQAKK